MEPNTPGSASFGNHGSRLRAPDGKGVEGSGEGPTLLCAQSVWRAAGSRVALCKCTASAGRVPAAPCLGLGWGCLSKSLA